MQLLLVFERQFVVTALLLLLTCFRSVRSPNTLVGTCNSADFDSRASMPCEPCPFNKWFELILEQRAGSANETNCFNNDPLGTQLPLPCPQSLTKGRDYPQLDLTKTPRGFIITKLPFFRYNTIPLSVSDTCAMVCPSTVCINSGNVTTTVSSNTTTTPTPPTGNSTGTTPTYVPPEDNLDIGNVEHYYNNTSNFPIDGHNVDFQLLEWPGRTHDDQTKFLDNKVRKECEEGKVFKSHRPYLCSLNKNLKPSHFRMLKFQRGSSKMLHYPCNQAEGTSIVALGLNAVFEETENDDHPHSKLYLSYSNISIFKTHAHPLYVSEHILNQMAKEGDDAPLGICRRYDPEEENCDFTQTINASAVAKDDLCLYRQTYFLERVRVLLNKTACEAPFNNQDPQCKDCREVKKQISGDLRTVLDFTFVQGRLLLGMRCGILIISDFLNRILDIRPASLLSAKGKHTNTFHPINKIASSFCCKPTGCRRTIVAAYSSWQDRGVDSPKEIYISFDLGSTFQVKLVAEPISALNLMWGLYKQYGKWILYHQLLESPDQEDLKDERGFELHPGYVELRTVPDWDSLSLNAKEKRFLYGESSARSLAKDLKARKRALRRYIRLRTSGALGRFVRYRRQGKEIDLDLAPDWLKTEIREHRERATVPWKDRWTDSNCDSVAECRRNFKNDDAVDYFLKDADVIVKTRKRHAHEEPFCDQIQSIAVLEEEDSLYILCRVGFGDFSEPYKSPGSPSSCSSRDSNNERADMPNCTYPVQNTTGHPSKVYPYNECVNPTKYYAIFTASVKEKLPLVVIEERRSERLFTCKPVKVDMDWDGCKSRYVSPELVRVPSSIVLLVKNCEDTLYYSPNGGRTIFNTQFYAHRSQFAGIKNSGVNSNCSQIDDCNINQTSTSNQRQLMYRIKALDVPPLISIHRQTNNVVFMTMRNMYAYGLLGINSEFRMIVGEIFPNIEENVISKIRSNDFVFPDFSFSGMPIFGVALKLVYSHNQVVSCELYSSRHGMRLVQMSFFFYKDVSYYYNENLDLDSEARTSDLGLSVCQTHSFAANPNYLALDAGEGGTVQVTTFDPSPNIPLGLVSSEEKSIIVDVSFVDRQRGEKDHLSHDWDIHVKALHNYKTRETALVDSFFGVENNNMFGFYTEIGLANNVEFRCHVQPVATVSVHIECRNKKLVAHEDEHRPQCHKGTFSKSAFEYRLKKGTFNPHLASYWKALDEQEGKELMRIERETGDMIIVYDYLRFGCPLEPYKDEPFVPELRVASADKKFNSSFGVPYNGSYLIFELFGSTGFSFTQTYNDYGCTYLPMNLTNATMDWVHRQRLFAIAQSRQKSYSAIAEISNATSTAELEKMEYGNQLFYPGSVDHPINIVNRVTYRDCKELLNFYLPSENKSFIRVNASNPLHGEYLQQQLPIFIGNDDSPTRNKVKWDKTSQNVYIFMAVALDPTESLCEYYTIFGVHLPQLAEINALITLLVFLVLIILWIVLFFCGYIIRKTRIRTLCIELERKRRLEEAAWKVVYQYERLLQENENIKFEEEFREFTENAEQAKDQTRKSKDKNKSQQKKGTKNRQRTYSVIQL